MQNTNRSDRFEFLASDRVYSHLREWKSFYHHVMNDPRLVWLDNCYRTKRDTPFTEYDEVSSLFWQYRLVGLVILTLASIGILFAVWGYATSSTLFERIIFGAFTLAGAPIIFIFRKYWDYLVCRELARKWTTWRFGPNVQRLISVIGYLNYDSSVNYNNLRGLTDDHPVSVPQHILLACGTYIDGIVSIVKSLETRAKDCLGGEVETAVNESHTRSSKDKLKGDLKVFIEIGIYPEDTEPGIFYSSKDKKGGKAEKKVETKAPEKENASVPGRIKVTETGPGLHDHSVY